MKRSPSAALRWADAILHELAASGELVLPGRQDRARRQILSETLARALAGGMSVHKVVRALDGIGTLDNWPDRIQRVRDNLE